MTIEEAIEHCKEIVTENRRRALEFARANVYDAARHCQACATEYEQLAEWLTELKQRREAEITAHPKTNADRIRQMTDEELADFMVIQAIMGAISVNGIQGKTAADKIVKEIIMEHKADEDISAALIRWLKQELSEDAAERTY